MRQEIVCAAGDGSTLVQHDSVFIRRIMIFCLSSALSVYCLTASAVTMLPPSSAPTQTKLMRLFPLEHYEQAMEHWLAPTAANYATPLLRYEQQQKHVQNFYQHYVGDASPWSQRYVKHSMGSAKAEHTLLDTEQKLINQFSNSKASALHKGYAANFRPYPSAWIEKIADNMQVTQLQQLKYDQKNRAIALTNLQARALPTDDVYFYSHEIAGQGYPFDHLQISAIWAGTPVYILGQTQDAAWYLVLTADFIGWVHSDGVARADAKFVDVWRTASQKQLAVITRTETSMVEQRNKQRHFKFLAYVGTVLPVARQARDIELMIPLRNAAQRAAIGYAKVAKQDVALLPLVMTRQNIAQVIRTLIHRPYGWGNAYFYNDCSAELKNLLAPFGIWLPRNSWQQSTVGRMVDVSDLSLAERLQYVQQHGQPWLTLIYVDGHIMLYMGNYPDSQHPEHPPMVMTYQNVWALYPKPSIRRGVIGQALFFPLLEHYPEDIDLQSQANRKYFKLVYLSETD